MIKKSSAKRARSYFSRSGWYAFGERNFYFRSTWELKYAKYLQFLKEQKQILEWEYEPKTFWFENIKRGTRSYLPDFKVTNLDGTHFWIEVKGYLDAKSKTKLKRFKKYYPQENIYVRDKEWFKKNM